MDFSDTLLRRLVLLSTGIAALGLLTTMLVTCADVIPCIFGHLFHPGKALLKP